MNRDHFVVTVFSTDSTHLYDNKLSKFTTEFNEPIDLRGDEWEVAVRRLVGGAIADDHREVVGDFNDVINLDHPETLKFNSLQELTDMLISHALEPSIYSTDYFSSYLNPAIQFELPFLNQAYPKDRIQFDDNEPLPPVVIKTEVELKHIYSQAEIESMQVPKHITDIETYDKYNVVTSLPVNKSPFTMRQVLNLMTRYFLSDFRGGARHIFHDDYLRAFTKNKEPEKSFAQVLKEFKEHKAHGNKIVHELVKAFVEATQESRKKFGAIHPKENTANYIFLYCDAVENSIVGSGKARILKVSSHHPLPGTETHFDPTLDYKRVEKKFIKSISFELRSVDGELINFASSKTPTMISLEFRRVKPDRN